MHPIQSQFFADHHNFERLLNRFEAELSWYERGQPWRADLSVILNFFDYVQFYPETYHHPVEEAIYEVLLAKGAANRDVINRLAAQRKELADITRRAGELFSAVANDIVVPTDTLLEAGREFLQAHRQHLAAEAEFIYPRLSDHMSDDEWEHLAAEGKAHELPFSEALEKEYHSLYEAILESEDGIWGTAARGINTPPYRGRAPLQ